MLIWFMDFLWQNHQRHIYWDLRRSTGLGSTDFMLRLYCTHVIKQAAVWAMECISKHIPKVLHTFILCIQDISLGLSNSLLHDAQHYLNITVFSVQHLFKFGAHCLNLLSRYIVVEDGLYEKPNDMKWNVLAAQSLQQTLTMSGFWNLIMTELGREETYKEIMSAWQMQKIQEGGGLPRKGWLN